ncbi:MAG: hypothetical protein ABGX87_12770 [Alcanivorax sp.]
MSEFSIEIGKFLAIIVSVVVLFIGFSRRQEKTFQEHLDTKFENLGKELTRLNDAKDRNAGQIAKVERDLLELKADLPEKYVRREDHIRGQSLIESKLDGLAMKLENLQLREAKRDRP